MLPHYMTYSRPCSKKDWNVHFQVQDQSTLYCTSLLCLPDGIPWRSDSIVSITGYSWDKPWYPGACLDSPQQFGQGVLLSLVWIIAMTVSRPFSHLLCVAECFLVKIPEDSTPMKIDHGTSIKEVTGQCEGGGEMDWNHDCWLSSVLTSLTSCH